MLPSDEPAAAHEEDLDHRLGPAEMDIFLLRLIHRQGDDVPVVRAAPGDLLPFPDGTDALDQIPVFRRLLVFQRFGRRIHFFRKSPDLLLVVSAEELQHLLHLFPVFLLRHPALAGRRALADMMVEAGPVLPDALRQLPVAAADAVKLPQQIDSVPHGSRRGKGPEIAGGILLHFPGNGDAGVHLPGGDADERVALVVLEHRIVFGPVLLDQVRFQHQRLQLGVRDDVLKIIDILHHPHDLRALVPRALEILAHPVLQAHRLADVDDLPVFGVHEIDPRLSRKLLQFFFNNESVLRTHPRT